jgi:hypothetical protein
MRERTEHEQGMAVSELSTCAQSARRHVLGMTISNELAQWAPDDATWSMLAETANLRGMMAGEHGLDDRAMQRAWTARRGDVDTAVPLVGLCRSEKWLRKLARDRRVKVRIAVYANPVCPIDVLDMAAIHEKSWDPRDAAHRALARRVPNLPADEAVALVRDGVSEKLLAAVAANRNLQDEQVLDLLGLSVQIGTRNAGVTQTVEMARQLAAECDLRKRSDEVVLAMARAGMWHVAAREAASRKRAEVCETLLGELEAAERRTFEQRNALQLLAKAPEMDRRYYERIVACDEQTVTSQAGANTSCPWDVLGEVVVRRGGTHALGRALAEAEVPQASWRLATEICEQNAGVTVAEVVALVMACE